LGGLARRDAAVLRPERSDAEERLRSVSAVQGRSAAALWALAALTGLAFAIRFASLGVQSYHHDEVITVARVLPGSFVHMLREVRDSESNPPLYYVLAWFWAKVFGSGEVGLRSLSALFGVATVPVAFLAAREALSTRAGLIAAAIVAVNPMLIWYSQEARSYALLVLLGSLSLLFFLRVLHRQRNLDLALWALSSAGALCSHYFAVFAVGVEAAWLLVALRDRRREVLPAVAGVAFVGLALVPLIMAQVNPKHIGWIDATPLIGRLFQTGVSFLIGETGHVIAEPPRERYALIPALVAGIAVLLLAMRGSRAERRASRPALAVGLGVLALAALAALAGKDYVVERNLLPALVPLVVVVAIGFAVERARRAGVVCAVVLCAYWLGFAVYVDRTPNLQRPDFRGLAERLGPPTVPRAIVGWKLAADPMQYYLDGGSKRIYSGETPVREIDVIKKPIANTSSATLPRSFHQVERVRLERLTLIRYRSRPIREVPYYVLRNLATGFGSNGVVADGLGLGSRQAPIRTPRQPSRSRPCRRCTGRGHDPAGGGSERS
jgi:mannosyltransferase